MKKSEKINILGPCATIFVATHTGSWRLERPSVDFKSCVKCGTCSNYCPANVIRIHKDAEICVTFDWDYCKGCGICANECPKRCITMIDERSAKNGSL